MYRSPNQRSRALGSANWAERSMHGAKAEGWLHKLAAGRARPRVPLGTDAAAHYLAPISTDLPRLAAGALRMGRLSSAG
jgi:hypothetical protein